MYRRLEATFARASGAASHNAPTRRWSSSVFHLPHRPASGATLLRQASVSTGNERTLALDESCRGNGPASLSGGNQVGFDEGGAFGPRFRPVRPPGCDCGACQVVGGRDQAPFGCGRPICLVGESGPGCAGCARRSARPSVSSRCVGASAMMLRDGCRRRRSVPIGQDNAHTTGAGRGGRGRPGPAAARSIARIGEASCLLPRYSV
jgi:hypothetical protein